MSEVVNMRVLNSPIKNKSRNKASNLLQNKVIIFKLLLNILIGQIVSVLSINEQFIQCIRTNMEFNVILKTLLPCIVQYVTTAVIILCIMKRIPKPKLILIALGVLSVVIDCIGKYGFNRVKTTKDSIDLSDIFTFVFLLVYFLITKILTLSRKSSIGLIILFISLIVTLALIEKEGTYLSIVSLDNLFNVLVAMSIGLCYSM